MLYDKTTIDTLIWPDTESGLLARKYLTPLIKEGISPYIANVKAEIFAFKIDNHVFPIVLSENHYDNAYVCSPFTHYISLGLESASLISPLFVRKMLSLLLKGFGKILKTGGIEKTIYINNWLFSTDLYPSNLSEDQILKITQFFKKKFPSHVILFRSLNEIINEPLIKCFKNLDYKLLLSRNVFITDTKNEEIFKTRILKSDLKLWKEKEYQLVDTFSEEEKGRILELYQTLSIENHSKFNPYFTLKFLDLLITQKILNLKGLKNKGVIEGVHGYMEGNSVFFCPYFGYDRDHPESNKIYRILSTSLLLEARNKKSVFHQSAGASFYKTLRRSQPCLEYTAVYTKHLPLKQRLAWSLLRGVINTTAASMMKKY